MAPLQGIEALNEVSLQPESFQARRVLCLLGVLTIALYLLGFNFYVQPSNGDDVTYFLGAKSLATGEGYTEQGLWIQDWPPVQSLLSACAMFLTGVKELYVVKLVNLPAVLLSLFLSYRLMTSEGRSQPLLACMLIAISPTSLLVGTAGQADFTFFALSMCFFIILERVRLCRRWSDAVLCGLILGAASLTRYQGVLLGAGIVFQAGQLVRQMKWKSIHLEATSACIGASIFLGWKYWLHLCQLEGKAAGTNYEFQAESIWWQPSLLELGGEILNFFAQLENLILTFLPDGNWLVGIATIGFLLLLFLGFYRRICDVGWKATDVYVLATLSLYTIYAYKEARYFIPLAPFLFDYFYRALSAVLRRPQAMRAFVVVWFLGLLAIDGVLLFYGDGQSMGPRCQLLLENERDYVRGHYRDLYDVSHEMRQAFPEAVLACDKFHTRIVRHYSQLETEFPGYEPDKPYDFYLEVPNFEFSEAKPDILQNELRRPEVLEGRLSAPETRGKVTIWKVD